MRIGGYCFLLILPAYVLSAQSFGVSLKGIHLGFQREVSVYNRECGPGEGVCALHHWWSGGTFAGYTTSRVRYYVDDLEPVDLPLGLAHGMSTQMEDNGPWSAGSLMGKSGVGLHQGGASAGSGFFNTYNIPFGKKVNVTVTLDGPAGSGEYFWLVLRGRTQASIVLPGGLSIPPTARLRSYEYNSTAMTGYQYLPVFNSTAKNGAVLMTVLAVQAAGRYEFLEGCMRAYDNTSSDPWLLSSGTEDYFLGTFYFDKGQYFLPLAGVTSLCPQPKDGAPRGNSFGCVPIPGVIQFSAYRVHGGEDPLLFENGMAMAWRNGEPGHGGASGVVNATAFALVYEW